MDLSTGLVKQLQELTINIGDDGHAVDLALAALVGDLKAAVPSYCGLQLTITQNGFPVVLTSFGELNGSVKTSLRLQLRLLDLRVEEASRIVFYAGTPGTFVDLAADLAYALRDTDRERKKNHRDNCQQVDGHRPGIKLDADLPPPTGASGLFGLANLAAINRAVGVLIADGHDPDDAHETLREQAAAAGLEPHAWAIWLLQR